MNERKKAENIIKCAAKRQGISPKAHIENLLSQYPELDLSNIAEVYRLGTSGLGNAKSHMSGHEQNTLKNTKRRPNRRRRRRRRY